MNEITFNMNLLDIGGYLMEVVSIPSFLCMADQQMSKLKTPKNCLAGNGLMKRHKNE